MKKLLLLVVVIDLGGLATFNVKSEKQIKEVQASLTAIDFVLTETPTWYKCIPKVDKRCDVHAQRPKLPAPQ